MRQLIRDGHRDEARRSRSSRCRPLTALAPAVHAAERAGIPVISINSGSDAFAKLGTLLHVGENEYQAGYAAGQRMPRRTMSHRTLCVIHEPHNLGLEQRCRRLRSRAVRRRRPTACWTSTSRTRAPPSS